MEFLFSPYKWQQVALFEINDPELKKELNAETEKAALTDFFDREGNYKLNKYRKDVSAGSTKSVRMKEIEKLNDKVQLINMLHAGNLLQLYPIQVNGA